MQKRKSGDDCKIFACLQIIFVWNSSSPHLLTYIYPPTWNAIGSNSALQKSWYSWEIPPAPGVQCWCQVLILCPGQGLLGQTSHQVAEQIRLLMKCKFFIEKDSGEKEMAMQVILTSRISHVNISASKSSIRRFVITEKAPEITRGNVNIGIFCVSRAAVLS